MIQSKKEGFVNEFINTVFLNVSFKSTKFLDAKFRLTKFINAGNIMINILKI